VKRAVFVFLMCLAFVAACYPQAGIRGVDFKNFTYEAFCAGPDPEKVTVKNSEFSSEKKMDGYVDRFYFKVFDVAFGDLDGDKQDEAVILSVCNTGGTGNFSEGYVYKMKAGKPALVARIGGGDRAYGGLKSAKVAGGLAVVERFDPGENGASCCAEFILTENYKLEGNKIVAVGSAVKTPVYTTERISFDKGASGKTFTTTIEPDDRKRFVVGARAGQRLSVSTNSTDAQLRLLEEARVTEGINNFLAVLPKNGDYTIEILNAADRPIQITVNIKIQ
jgi:hypothetical protein